MHQSIVLTLGLATSAVRELQAALSLSSQPTVGLAEQVSLRVARFLCAPITPASTRDFEEDLRRLLDECGRLVLESVFNHIEPEDPTDAPKHAQRDHQDYSRKNHKSPTRGGVATLFGSIDLQRCLYEPLQEARDDGQRCFAPLEVCLGIVAGNATPALAERVGRLAARSTQQEVLDALQREHHVSWSVKVLRRVTAAVSAGIAPYLREVQRQTLIEWLAQARQSRGRRRVTLAVGRDGILLPMRHEEHYKEGGVATLSVYDRRGRRLGTLYLGEMPQPKQVALSADLTALLEGVMAGCEGPLPRLVYLTDAGHHQRTYFKDVLSQMEDPRRPGQRLRWQWIVDYYHAASYVTRLAKVLFSQEQTQQAWARRMRRLMRDTNRGVIRVLHSAAQFYGRRAWTKAEAKEYAEAYGYLLRHCKEMKYEEYRRAGLPIGSGVTEAGCKVIFTQRFKESGMTWEVEGGEVILRLRLAVRSGVWDAVYREYLDHLPLVLLPTSVPLQHRSEEKVT